MENEAAAPYHLCEVWEEKGETSGRPDYTFRINGQTKFFVEAKAPSVPLDSVSHILQTKRYAWNSRDVFFAGLTDFEEFRFFDASLEPDARRPFDGEAIHLLYTEYLQNLDKLWELSRDRVAAGSLEQFLRRDRKSIRYRIPVDKRFLDELTEWRLELARSIHTKNPGIDLRQLNEIVQRLLDRIVFLRIAEDRQVIEPRQLWDIADLWEERGGKRPLMDDLVALFQDINNDFNGEIFKPHACEEVKVESPVLAKMIRRLYPPKSPYRFDVIGVELLGSIYERYLGNTLTLTAKQVRVEPKPQVRKAGGVYYTPKFIVDYIVKQTVGKLLEGKTPKEAQKLRILDPACGSGSFLLGAYQYLIDWHMNYYREHPKEANVHPMYPEVVKDANGNPRLSFHAKTRIMRQNLYGVDLDPQAVEITMMSLYLKALEAEKGMLGPKHEKLPELKYNIRCGNSLIAPDIEKETPLTAEERERLRPFDWHSREDGFGDILDAGGFDAVIGNPPYDVLEKERGHEPKPHLQLSEYLRATPRYEICLGGKVNLYRPFMVASVTVLRESGYYSQIIPMSFMGDISLSRTRRWMLTEHCLQEVAVFPQKDDENRRVFREAKLSTCIILVRKEKPVTANRIVVRTYPGNSFEEMPLWASPSIRDLSIIDPENLPIPIRGKEEIDLAVRIHSRCRRFVEIADISRGEINQTIYRKYISADKKKKPLLKGVEVRMFGFNPTLSQSEREYFDERGFEKGHKPKRPPKVRIATQRITGVDEARRLVCAISKNCAYFADSTNSIVSKDPWSEQFILGILNSNLFNWRFSLTSTNNNVGTNEISVLPVPGDISERDVLKLVEIVEALESLNVEKTAEIVKSADYARLNSLIYKIFHLSPEDVSLVESAKLKDHL